MARALRGLRKAWATVRGRSLDERLRLAVYLGDFDWAQTMLDQGADINFAPVKLEENMEYSLRAPRCRMTSLHLACIRADFEAAWWLLERGASTEIFDTWGTQPVQLAAERDHLHLVSLLASRGVSLDIYMPSYSTYAEDWLPGTIIEHVTALGFKGDEHLRCRAKVLSRRMNADTSQVKEGSSNEDGQPFKSNPARL